MAFCRQNRQLRVTFIQSYGLTIIQGDELIQIDVNRARNVFVRCYRHPETEAIGTCKACGKGLCVECVTDLGHGLACKCEHEELVETYNTIIEKNSQIYAAAPKNTLIAPAFFAFLGRYLWFMDSCPDKVFPV